jgi:hypothetical protein
MNVKLWKLNVQYDENHIIYIHKYMFVVLHVLMYIFYSMIK